MSPKARLDFLDAVNAALSDPRDLMSEGQPHKKAKSRAMDLLGLHFKALGRTVDLAEDLAVVYPGEEAFSPDVFAVLDVPQVEDDERLAWVVAEEKRGLDFVLEVLHHGDRQRDLTRNVERYARLGIPEYFVYDRANQRVLGHRLTQGARRYAPIVPQGGRYASKVLGIDLAVQGGRLRFFHGMAELFGSDDLIDRLNEMRSSIEARAAAEAARAEAALVGMRAAIFGALGARGLACTDAQRARVEACDDPATLHRWLLGAVTAATAEGAIPA